jgi:Uma2 family endonuclease
MPAPARNDAPANGASGSARRATYQDVLDAPPNQVAEIVDGVLYLSARPASPHAFSVTTLSMSLAGAFHHRRRPAGERPGGWWIVYEPELAFGENTLVPDLAGWCVERMPVFPRVARFTLAPDWVCEALSPSTASLDRVKKMDVYAREGVRHLWFVDPDARTLEVFRLDEGGWLRVAAFEGDGEVRAEPFDAVPLDLGFLWPPEEPAEPTPATEAPATEPAPTTEAPATEPEP